MSSIDIIKLNLVHVAALINVSGMFFRDQFMLRLLVLVSTLLYIVYYLVVPETPLWDAIAWCVVLTGVNAVMMVLIILDRKQFFLTEVESRLFPRQQRTLSNIAGADLVQARSSSTFRVVCRI